MRTILGFCFLFFLVSCHKNEPVNTSPSCNIREVASANAKKVTIANGVWGTVSFLEGNCMPMAPACSSCCQNCPVQRTVKIYEYTTTGDALGIRLNSGFFDGFTTKLIAEVESDQNGFFQATVPAGIYSIVVVENGKLYANYFDDHGGINPFAVVAGRNNINLAITYKAVF